MMSEITPRLHSILAVLNDIKDAFTTLLEKPNKHPALLVIYAFMDICAALSSSDPNEKNSEIFRSYLNEFMTPGAKRAIPPEQLWAARSALLHAFSPLGRHTGPGKSKPIFYYSWDEDASEVRSRLESRGYSDFSLLSVSAIQGIAIWTFNGMFSRAENNASFRTRVLANAEHLLLDYRTSRVEEFLRFLDQSKDE
jgi:hypothetical protein